MNRDEILSATREALAAAQDQAAHLGRLLARPEPRSGLPTSDEELERSYAFLHIFAQLHDVMLSRLFRGAITLVGEDPAALSAKTLSLRLERIGAIADRQRWLDLSSLRNMLVHDYAVTPEALARHVAAARASVPDLISTLAELASFIRKEGLFE